MASWALVTGKVLGGALLAWVQSLAFLLFSPFATTMGGYFTAAACLLMVAVAFTALGFTTAWVINSTQGFHAVLPQPISWAKQGKSPTVDFKIDLRLIGTDSISLVPVADQTSWKLSGNWQHPSFSGFLPASRSLTGQGFEANWRVSSLARMQLSPP